MEITVKVDDKEGPFLIELLRKFSFVHEVNQKQPSVAAERVYLLWQQKAEQLFASLNDFLVWMRSPNPAANNAVPYHLVESESGYETVVNLLGRMEHGVMA